jgi:hypothetical protein
MKHPSRWIALALGLACAASASADWLVVETNSSKFTPYELLPEGATITLGDGERISLFADSGSKVSFNGPGSFSLDPNAVGNTGRPVAQGKATLTRKLSQLMTAQGPIETPGVVRSAKSDAVPRGLQGRGFLNINDAPRRCIEEPGFVLVRDDTQKLQTAYVVLRVGERVLHKGTWYPGFNDLQLAFAPSDYDGDAGLFLEVYVGNKRIRKLALILLPGSLTVYDKLEFMFSNACRTDIAQLINSLPEEAVFQ